MLFPIFLGQFVRTYTNFRGHFLPLSAIGQGALLFVIYTTFCDTFMVQETGLSAPDVLLTVFLGKKKTKRQNNCLLILLFLVLLVQMLLLFVCYAIALRFNKLFTAADVVTIMFCATHKSLTLGKVICLKKYGCYCCGLFFCRHSNFTGDVSRFFAFKSD